MNGVYQRIEAHIPKMQGWCTPEKGKAMAEIIISHLPELTVELGVFGGRGLISMAMAHQAVGKGVAWGFDPWTKEAAVEGQNDPANDAWWRELDLEGIYRGFVGEVTRHSLLDRCFWARLKSQQAVSLFKDNSIGMIHADSNHSEQVSLDEVNRWVPKLARDGYWIADDIDWPTTKAAQNRLAQLGFSRIVTGTDDKWAMYLRA